MIRKAAKNHPGSAVILSVSAFKKRSGNPYQALRVSEKIL